MLESKYKGKISMLQNSGDSHVIERLSPSIPSNLDVETTLKQVLNSHGINYGPFRSHSSLPDPFAQGANVAGSLVPPSPAGMSVLPPYPADTFRGEPPFPGSLPSTSFPQFPAANPPIPFPGTPAVPPPAHISPNPAVPGASPFPSIPAGSGLPQNAGMGARFPPPVPGFGGESTEKMPPLDTSPRSAPGGGLFPSLCFVCLKKKRSDRRRREQWMECEIEWGRSGVGTG